MPQSQLKGGGVLQGKDGAYMFQWPNHEVTMVFLSDDQNEIVAAETYAPYPDGSLRYFESWFSQEALDEVEAFLNA